MADFVTVVLGEGVLTWPRYERVGDRYGVVNLMTAPVENLNDFSFTPDYVTLGGDPFAGSDGKLVATVLETRQSGHIGDIFRGFYPETPEVGEVIELGEGKLFFDDDETVGLEPNDGREADWLDPLALYRCHEQTVRLEFVTESCSRLPLDRKIFIPLQ